MLLPIGTAVFRFYCCCIEVLRVLVVSSTFVWVVVFHIIAFEEVPSVLATLLEWGIR